ncbi:hypothetical protein [Phosphitispora fastidiosa]|uniref:hypothetical protein n=1 Tax=Phosphitispora fastidiosa TaxID=2837202 RepID=UPI001E3AF067|nr:hypothetical protein [Phosphitispora fastidiosa]MBU7008850.1 hypothetical protein [Phosphitispora fastidiosa]
MMRKVFRRPIEYYDERISSIDEQICTLIKQRREISNNNPGFPPPEYISNWASKFSLYENLLNSVFGALANEKHFRPMVEPEGFRMHLPILKSTEKGEKLYTVTFIRQFTNASVVNFNVDWDGTNDSLMDRPQHSFFELIIGEQYNCRMAGGGGSTGHYTYNFIVSPPLSDDISGIDLVFKEYSAPHKPTGLEIVIHVE